MEAMITVIPDERLDLPSLEDILVRALVPSMHAQPKSVVACAVLYFGTSGVLQMIYIFDQDIILYCDHKCV